MCRISIPKLRFIVVSVALWSAAGVRLWAAGVTMKDGRYLEGRIGQTDTVADATPPSGDVNVRPILIVDTGLERIYVPQNRVLQVDPAAGQPKEKIRIPQAVVKSTRHIARVGPFLGRDPFDKFGRRIVSMRGKRGPWRIIQGITEITPVYVKVESLLNSKPSLVWEMRLATSSIPRETLARVLSHVIDPTQSDQRLRVVNLYLQAARFRDALHELQDVLKAFPDLRGPLEGEERALRQSVARRLVEEIEMRRAAAQHNSVRALLKNFPSDDVAGETLQQVREILEQYEQELARGEQVLKHWDRWSGEIEDEGLKRQLAKIREEIAAGLGFDTLSRMDAFLRLSDDATMGADQKLALAVSGWLLGGDDAIVNLPVALSVYNVRELTAAYLREKTARRRSAILDEMRSYEGATVRQVAKLLAHMKPPLTSSPVPEGPAGFYSLQVPGLIDEPDVTYYVQLPPEYDPHRRYPTILTLNGSVSPQKQLNWWSGAPNENGVRAGQAMRFGYITIAVDWQRPHQQAHAYSAREHHAVLASLRDACRRFAVDTDRVFLSGHGIGGDAAWDMGLSHPDLWAGVIPISAVADGVCKFYRRNARHVPIFVVLGELDGDKLVRSAPVIDKALRTRYDITVAELLGRGHEHFSDEILSLFDWMSKHKRDFYCREFECETMRGWDNFFWWLELAKSPRRKKKGSVKVSGVVRSNNHISASTGRSPVTVWLTPELVNFEKRISIKVDGRRPSRETPIRPELEVLLEDARSRGDRQHPFWAKVELAGK